MEEADHDPFSLCCCSYQAFDSHIKESDGLRRMSMFLSKMDSKHPVVFERQVFQDAELVFSTSDKTVEVMTKQSKQSGRQGGGPGAMHTERNTANNSRSTTGPLHQFVRFTARRNGRSSPIKNLSHDA